MTNESINNYPQLEFITRDLAKSLGLRFYRNQTGCKQGHLGLRYTSSKGCRECIESELYRSKRSERERNKRNDKQGKPRHPSMLPQHID